MPSTPKTARPNMARKHTRTTEANRKAGLDVGFKITVDGRVYQVRAGDLNGLDMAAMRREVGMTFGQLSRIPSDEWDLDIIAAIVWLARRVNGEPTLTYAEVAQEMTYDDLDDLGMDEADSLDEDDPGEAGAGA